MQKLQDASFCGLLFGQTKSDNGQPVAGYSLLRFNKVRKTRIKWGQTSGQTPIGGGGQRSRIDRSIARQCLVSAPIEM